MPRCDRKIKRQRMRQQCQVPLRLKLAPNALVELHIQDVPDIGEQAPSYMFPNRFPKADFFYTKSMRHAIPDPRSVSGSFNKIPKKIESIAVRQSNSNPR